MKERRCSRRTPARAVFEMESPASPRRAAAATPTPPIQPTHHRRRRATATPPPRRARREQEAQQEAASLPRIGATPPKEGGGRGGEQRGLALSSRRRGLRPIARRGYEGRARGWEESGMDGDAGATSPPRQLASSRWRFGAMVRPEQSYVHAGGAKGSCWRVGVSFCALVMAECGPLTALLRWCVYENGPLAVRFGRLGIWPGFYFAFCVVRGGG